MKIRQFDLYLAELNPRVGTEPGKVRPVIVVQTDLLNKIHPSTIICTITTKVISEAFILRIHLKKGESGFESNSDIIVDQVRAIDNKRFVKWLGSLDKYKVALLKQNLKIVMDL
jgi:mRNA interferase MazF